MKPICRHCQRRGANRPRGLCWTCYYSPGVRERYTSGSKFAHRGTRNFYGAAPLGEPTTAKPGSAEKVAVLAQRALLGQSLFHPRDSQGDEAERPGPLPQADEPPITPEREPNKKRPRQDQ